MSEGLVELVEFNPTSGLFSPRAKVVQIYVDEKPLLLFQDKDNHYHADILEKFLKDRNIPFGFKPHPRVKETTIASPKGDRYRVCGMGKLELDVSRKRYIDLCDGSHDYGMDIDLEHGKLVKQTFVFMGWKPYY